MKIAIHHRAGSFSDLWIDFCEKNGINYKIVDAYDNDIIQRLTDCDAFMWHFHHAIYKDTLIAKNILTTLQLQGKIVFPNIQTCYTFDDKVSQKYQLEAVGAPIVPSYVFFNKKDALKWVAQTEYPKVFKLTGGAGASNVKLINNKTEAKVLIKKAFKKGISTFNPYASIHEHWGHYQQGQITFIDFAKRAIVSLRKSEYKRYRGNECGYVYFQDFIPNNTGDIRIVVIGDKAFGLNRTCRKGDFRASGSGIISYEKPSKELAAIAFSVSRQMQADCVAFDFIYDCNQKPLIVEISYGFTASAYFKCPGFWDADLVWHTTSINPGALQMELIIKKITETRHGITAD